MLEELRIQNFQTHTKQRLVFGVGITTIVGPSDVGKSALVRALRWVATNYPGGDAFVQHGTKGCTVRLTVDGQHITRKRGGNGAINTYHLGAEEYKAFGRGVPDTIAAFLNMPDVCWQGQHDPSFWFGASAGDVSRQLNAIVDLGVIDTTLTNVGRTYSRARTKLELVEEVLTEAVAAQRGLDWVPGCDSALLAVETLYGDGAAATGLATSLRVLRRSAAEVRAQLGTLADAADATQTLAQAAGVAVDAAGAAARLKSLRFAALGAAQAAARPVPDFAPVQRTTKAAVVAANRARALAELVRAAVAAKANLCQTKKNLTEAQKALPKTCPTCGRS